MDDINQGIPESIIVNETAELLAQHLYDRTAKSRVTGKKELQLHPPTGTEKEVLLPLVAAIGSDESHPALENIASIAGKKDLYYYDSRIMTPQYAQIDALLSDKDILATIASVVRTDSKTYPRPTPVYKMTRAPFFFTKDEVFGAVARMKAEDTYKDIDIVTASNGQKAIFSTLYLSRQYAQGLFEQEEVLDRENP